MMLWFPWMVINLTATVVLFFEVPGSFIHFHFENDGVETNHELLWLRRDVKWNGSYVKPAVHWHHLERYEMSWRLSAQDWHPYWNYIIECHCICPHSRNIRAWICTAWPSSPLLLLPNGYSLCNHVSSLYIPPSSVRCHAQVVALQNAVTNWHMLENRQKRQPLF